MGFNMCVHDLRSEFECQKFYATTSVVHKETWQSNFHTGLFSLACASKESRYRTRHSSHYNRFLHIRTHIGMKKKRFHVCASLARELQTSAGIGPPPKPPNVSCRMPGGSKALGIPRKARLGEKNTTRCPNRASLPPRRHCAALRQNQRWPTCGTYGSEHAETNTYGWCAYSGRGISRKPNNRRRHVSHTPCGRANVERALGKKEGTKNLRRVRTAGTGKRKRRRRRRSTTAMSNPAEAAGTGNRNFLLGPVLFILLSLCFLIRIT